MASKRELHMVFIDQENRDDKVPQKILGRCLESRGLPVAYIRAIKHMHDGPNLG